MMTAKHEEHKTRIRANITAPSRLLELVLGWLGHAKNILCNEFGPGSRKLREGMMMMREDGDLRA